MIILLYLNLFNEKVFKLIFLERFMSNYSSFIGKKRLEGALRCQTPNFREGEDTCTVWYDPNTGVIRAINPDFDSSSNLARPVILRYSGGMAEPVLVNHNGHVGKVLQKVLDTIRVYRENQLDRIN